MDDNDEQNLRYSVYLPSSNLTVLDSTARTAPISLTYFHYCLENGMYTVKLRFTEIQYTNDKTYNSLGSISSCAIDHLIISSSCFCWADVKGCSRGGKQKTAYVVVGVGAGAFFIVLLSLCILKWKGYFRGRTKRRQGMDGLDLQTGTFSLKQIKAATNDFDSANKIGEGGFGAVYKACHLQQTGNLMRLVNEKLKAEVNEEEAKIMIKVALLCTNASPSLRPMMSEVVNMLEGKMAVPDVIPEPSTYCEDLRFKAMRDIRKHGQQQSHTECQTQNSTTINALQSSSSTLSQDLFEENQDSIPLP
ncbi:hypothetical protein EUGRSUZ_L00813 [Eucalyptus grandis]|uniref:non-specific serine/threonine protein kinase n=3 Tax=Eucalyptus grandis TaxID=71139 RepID=A0AAD9TBD6_EUCGR|nr:hypothetical protein EUGRSUZ_L00813 [Eucalyptus grandis]